MSRPARLSAAAERNLLAAVAQAVREGRSGITLTWEPKKQQPGELLVRAKPFTEGRMTRLDADT